MGKLARNSIPAYLRGIRSCLCVVALVQLVSIFSMDCAGAPQEPIAQEINQNSKSTFIRSGRDWRWAVQRSCSPDARAPGEHAHLASVAGNNTAAMDELKRAAFSKAITPVLIASSATGAESKGLAKKAKSRIEAVGTRTKSCCDGMKMADASPGPNKAADEKAAPTRREVMDPSRFVGMAGIGYASAKACPEVMEKLFCYCGCDLTDKHTSLLDCFTSIHGLDCHICQEEAVLANKMHNDGVSVQEIQKTIDDKYTKDYPFQEDTPAYKQYKSGRYLKDSDKPTKFGKEAAGPEAPDDKSTHKTPKLKPGKKAGQCCSAAGHEHDEKSSDSSKSNK